MPDRMLLAQESRIWIRGISVPDPLAMTVSDWVQVKESGATPSGPTSATSLVSVLPYPKTSRAIFSSSLSASTGPCVIKLASVLRSIL